MAVRLLVLGDVAGVAGGGAVMVVRLLVLGDVAGLWVVVW